MDAAQLVFLRRQAIAAIRCQPKLRKLRALLQDLAPNSYPCFQGWEEDINKLLSRGFVQSGKRAKYMRGEPCACHSNSASLWENNKDRAAIMTGYALSDDGVWRSHTWTVDTCKPVDAEGLRRIDGEFSQIYETTCKRELYFGYQLTDAEAEAFAAANY